MVPDLLSVSSLLLLPLRSSCCLEDGSTSLEAPPNGREGDKVCLAHSNLQQGGALAGTGMYDEMNVGEALRNPSLILDLWLLWLERGTDVRNFVCSKLLRLLRTT